MQHIFVNDLHHVTCTEELFADTSDAYAVRVYDEEHNRVASCSFVELGQAVAFLRTTPVGVEAELFDINFGFKDVYTLS